MSHLTAAAPASIESQSAQAAKPRPTDWSGLWFKLVEDAGEFVGMRGGRYVGPDQIDWVFPRHAEYDGLGGFVHVLRASQPDRDFAVPVRKTSKPSFAARALALIHMVVRKPVPAAAWRHHNKDWSGHLTKAGSEFATRVVEAKETRRLDVRARALGVSLNTLLLKTLADATRPELEEGPEIWMMPVNMRGPVTLERDTSNQSGYLQIELGDDKSAGAVQEAFKRSLRRRDHWATWTFLNVSKLVGLSGIRRIYGVQMARFGQRPFVGAFSNLGRWSGVGLWHVCPCVARTCPVGVGAIVCDGQLSLTLEAHPSIAREQGWTKPVMDRWVDLLLSA